VVTSPQRSPARLCRQLSFLRRSIFEATCEQNLDFSLDARPAVRSDFPLLLSSLSPHVRLSFHHCDPRDIFFSVVLQAAGSPAEFGLCLGLGLFLLTGHDSQSRSSPLEVFRFASLTYFIVSQTKFVFCTCGDLGATTRCVLLLSRSEFISAGSLVLKFVRLAGKAGIVLKSSDQKT
jgi:hypothetical protein